MTFAGKKTFQGFSITEQALHTTQLKEHAALTAVYLK